nr:hypothetical protein [uncultured Neisseria sp.]
MDFTIRQNFLEKSASKEKDEIRGIVRITVPQWNDNGRILARLLVKCADYPELYKVFDWLTEVLREMYDREAT